jgi:hypothetical protein
MIWIAETVYGDETWYRADTEHNGEPIALVVFPAGRKNWDARAGRGSTMDIAHRGSDIASERTAERAKASAAGWAEGV